jgi:hypothetical protein
MGKKTSAYCEGGNIYVGGVVFPDKNIDPFSSVNIAEANSTATLLLNYKISLA